MAAPPSNFLKTECQKEFHEVAEVNIGNFTAKYAPENPVGLHDHEATDWL